MIVQWGTSCKVVVATLLILWMVKSGFAQESKPSEEARRPRLGGPDAVENQMETDRAEKDALYEFKFLKPYFDWQARNKEKHGFSIGLDYTGVYLKASDSLPGTDDYASSGMVRIFGSWELLGRGTDTTGTLIYKVEHRHAYTDTAPNGFSLGNLGNVGAIEPPFSDQGTRLTNLYWRQSWNKDRVVAVGGFLDSTDFVDIFALGSPWLHFMNLSFTHFVSDNWMPFLRAGYADDGGSLLQKSVSTGVGYQPNPIGGAAGNLLGLGINWGQPNEAVFGSGLDDQYAFELFYRLQVTKELAITPDIQFLINPALNPDEDNI